MKKCLLLIIPFILTSCGFAKDKSSLVFEQETINGDGYFKDFSATTNKEDKTITLTYGDFTSSSAKIKNINGNGPEYEDEGSVTSWIGSKTTVKDYWYFFDILLNDYDKSFIVSNMQSIIDEQMAPFINGEKEPYRQDIYTLMYHKITGVSICLKQQAVDGKIQKDRNRSCLYAILDDYYYYYSGIFTYNIAPEIVEGD